MVKRRPVIVLSPKISARPGLCTVVALSTSPPKPIMAYHCQVDFDPPLPDRMASKGVWVKGDMVAAVGFHRLSREVEKRQAALLLLHAKPSEFKEDSSMRASWNGFVQLD